MDWDMAIWVAMDTGSTATADWDWVWVWDWAMATGMAGRPPAGHWTG